MDYPAAEIDVAIPLMPSEQRIHEVLRGQDRHLESPKVLTISYVRPNVAGKKGKKEPPTISRSCREVECATVLPSYDSSGRKTGAGSYVLKGESVALQEQAKDWQPPFMGESMEVCIDGVAVEGWDFRDKWQPPQERSVSDGTIRSDHGSLLHAGQSIMSAMATKQSRLLGTRPEKSSVSAAVDSHVQGAETPVIVSDSLEATEDVQQSDESCDLPSQPLRALELKPNAGEDTCDWWCPNACEAPPSPAQRSSHMQQPPRRVAASARHSYINRYHNRTPQRVRQEVSQATAPLQGSVGSIGLVAARLMQDSYQMSSPRSQTHRRPKSATSQATSHEKQRQIRPNLASAADVSIKDARADKQYENSKSSAHDTLYQVIANLSRDKSGRIIPVTIDGSRQQVI